VLRYRALPELPLGVPVMPADGGESSFRMVLTSNSCPRCGAVTYLRLSASAEGSVAVAGEQPPPVDNRAQHADWHERTGT
jgi:hypothetical protein